MRYGYRDWSPSGRDSQRRRYLVDIDNNYKCKCRSAYEDNEALSPTTSRKKIGTSSAFQLGLYSIL